MTWFKVNFSWAETVTCWVDDREIKWDYDECQQVESLIPCSDVGQWCHLHDKKSLPKQFENSGIQGGYTHIYIYTASHISLCLKQIFWWQKITIKTKHVQWYEFCHPNLNSLAVLNTIHLNTVKNSPGGCLVKGFVTDRPKLTMNVFKTFKIHYHISLCPKHVWLK